MPAPSTVLGGDALLVTVTDAMVALHQRYHHRAPATAKTTILGGTYPPACSVASTPMQKKCIDAVERLSGRAVLAFISNHHVGPDMEIELLLLQPVPDPTTAGDHAGKRPS